jgi:hypothetical protein
VVLHLRCNLTDIGQIEFNNHVVDPYDNIEQLTELQNYVDDSVPQKIKNISSRLHNNDVNKRSDCFWCTYTYDTSPIYIPKSKLNDQFQGYGSFCCPECAAGYLFKERIDHSTKMERYHLLHDFYEYEKSIVPAPSPYYLLSKYYGSLTIQEYRQMIREKVCMMIDKPFCCQYPELVQTMDYSKQYKLCRKTT